MRRTFWVLVLSLLFVVCGATSLSASCTASQTCQAPPFGVSCSGATSCTVGPDWVDCDGNRIDCNPVAACTGSCNTNLQCYSVCSAEGGDPAYFICDKSVHCCRCYF
ncbi:MAG TPA: hypothetical protein VN851_15470 [Thermoanaerobaculia bacterium]|nr:hypothetical protein [Thermoanaerobaculia bacterium]